jgi:RNA polymerase sigma-70 factor, ECF subfamily
MSGVRAYPLRKTHVRPRYETAYLEAFDTHADALFRHACYRLSDRERARDVTQDAFIKAWDYVAGGGEVRHWKSFLYRIVNNLIIDEYRRTKEASLDALFEEDPGSSGTLAMTESLQEIEASLDDARSIEKIQGLIRQMPDPYRAVLVMRYIDGLSPREIAHALEETENAVSVRLHRGTGKLKELCQEHHIL